MHFTQAQDNREMTGFTLRGSAFALTLCSAVLAWAPPPATAATFDLPSIDRIVNYTPKLPLQIYTADGVEDRKSVV